MTCTVKAWPNMKLFGKLADVPRNVFSRKLDHSLDFSFDVLHRVRDMGIEIKTVNRIVNTHSSSMLKLVTTNHYELVFDSEESATVAMLTLSPLIGNDVG